MFEKSTFGSRDNGTADKEIDKLIDAAEGAVNTTRAGYDPFAALAAVHQCTIHALVEAMRIGADTMRDSAETPPTAPWARRADDPVEIVDRTVRGVEAEYDSSGALQNQLNRLTNALAEANLTIHGLYRVMRTKLGVSAADIATAVEEQRTGRPFRDQPGVPSDDEIAAMEEAANAAGTTSTLRGHSVTFHIEGHDIPVVVEYGDDEMVVDLLGDALAAAGIDNLPEEYDVRVGFANGALLDLAWKTRELSLKRALYASLKPLTNDI